MVKGQLDWLVEVTRVPVADADGHDSRVDFEGLSFLRLHRAEVADCWFLQVGVAQHGHGGKTLHKWEEVKKTWTDSRP